MFTKPSKYAILNTRKRLEQKAATAEQKTPMRGLLQRTLSDNSNADTKMDLSSVDDLVLRVRKSFNA